MRRYELDRINDIDGSHDETTMIYDALGDLHILHIVVDNQKYIYKIC
jgi:hypothetical protein